MTDSTSIDKMNNTTKKEITSNDSSSNAEQKNLTDINWKSYGVLAVLFMIVTSDVFQENVLSCFSSAMDGSIVTTTGMLITAIVLIIAHILIMYNI